MYRTIFCLFVICLNFSKAISVYSKVDTTSGNIGNVFSWFIRVENYGKLEIEFPELEIKDENMSIWKESLIKNKLFFEKKFEIIFWDTGNFNTPNYQIIINETPEKQSSIDVPIITINISTNPNIANDEELRPLIGPVEMNSYWTSKNNILSGLLLFLLILIFFVISKRRGAKFEKFNYLTLTVPKVYAIERLDNISENCSPKDFYSELSHISREFFEKKYFIRSLEMTTNEIIENQKLFSLDATLFDNWIEILNYADKVKYAQEMAKSKRMQADLHNLKSIINSIEN